jgi:hypothetical protein
MLPRWNASSGVLYTAETNVAVLIIKPWNSLGSVNDAADIVSSV